MMSIVRAMASPGQETSLEGAEILVPARRGNRLWLPFVGLVTAMLCMPFARAIFWLGDEGVLLHGADRMLKGSTLYVDFFEFLPPGGFVLTAAWFSVTGVSFLSARTLAVLTFVGIACFTYLACQRVSRNAPLSALLTIGWVMMSQGPWMQVSHHWFTTLFAMVGAWAALAGLEQRAIRWPLIAGVAVGAAAMVTPTRGALAALAALTAFLNLRQNRTGSITYVLGVMLVPVGLVIYLALNHSLGAAFDDVIRFTASRYAAIQYAPFGLFASAQNFPLIYLFPLAAVLTLMVCARDWRAALGDRPLQLCAAFGLAGFIGCYPRPDIFHISYTAPLAYPLLVLCVSRLTPRWHPAFRSTFAAVAIVLHVPSVLIFSLNAQHALRDEAVPTPRGDVKLVIQGGAREMLARIQATPPGDAFFFYPNMTMLPFLTGREHVAKYDIFVPGYTLPSQYHDACLSVMRRADWLIIDRTWIGPEAWKLTFPAMQNAQPQETLDFEQALDGGFDFVALDGTFELRRRRKDASEAVCTGSAK
jgi:hypothetical protein